MLSNHFPVHLRAQLRLADPRRAARASALGPALLQPAPQGRTVWAIPVTAALAIAVLAILIRPPDRVRRGNAVRAVRAGRARSSSSAAPPATPNTPRRSTSAPRGIKLDTPEEIKAQASAIEQQAVQTQAMPLGNVTGMTQSRARPPRTLDRPRSENPLMLEITTGGLRFVARFEEELAPQTVAAFKGILPFDEKIIHCRWSGESNWIPWGDRELGIGPENATSYPAPRRARPLPGRDQRDGASLSLRVLLLRIEGRSPLGEPLRDARRGTGSTQGARPPHPLGRRTGDHVPRGLTAANALRERTVSPAPPARRTASALPWTTRARAQRSSRRTGASGRAPAPPSLHDPGARKAAR